MGMSDDILSRTPKSSSVGILRIFRGSHLESQIARAGALVPRLGMLLMLLMLLTMIDDCRR